MATKSNSSKKGSSKPSTSSSRSSSSMKNGAKKGTTSSRSSKNQDLDEE